jgi:RNA-directed DNA polymerase
MAALSELMQRMRHLPVREQAVNLNRVLRGHYAYYGIAGNFRALKRLHRFVERYWRKMLSSRSRKGYVTWEAFLRIKTSHPIMPPKLHRPYPALQRMAVL